jgi:hypothetical protein
MDNEVLNKIIAQTSALERVVTLLLSDRLQRLPESDLLTLRLALDPDNLKPPTTSNLSDADDFAGRTLEYQRVVKRIVDAAQEIAKISGDRRDLG